MSVSPPDQEEESSNSNLGGVNRENIECQRRANGGAGIVEPRGREVAVLPLEERNKAQELKVAQVVHSEANYEGNARNIDVKHDKKLVELPEGSSVL